MNIKSLDSGKPSRILASFLSIIVILAIALPGSGGVSAQEANPRIVASITFNWFDAQGFPPTASVNAEIYSAPGGEQLWSGTRTTDESGTAHFGEWEHPVNLVPGIFIVISDGTTTKELELEAVTLDTFDTAADLLAGTAPPVDGGRFVWAGAGNESYGCGMELTADPVSGAWTADFTTQEPPCDVVDGMWGAAQIFDADGDASEANPLPPPPPLYIRAHPVWDAVDAWSWPQDATLHLTIDDPATVAMPDFAMDMPGGVDPDLGSVWFDFAGAYDLKPGDMVTVTDGATTRSLVVSILSIDAFDLAADTVSGTVEPGAQVRLPIPNDELLVTAGSEGQWVADFTPKSFDLTAGMTVIAEFFDEDGDNSSFELWIPSPWLTAFPEWDFVEGFEWPMGVSVHLAVDDPGTEPAPDLEADDTVDPSPWGDPRTYVSYEFAGDYDLKAGDGVSLSDGVTERTMVVQSLSITYIDIEADTVSGTADPGAIVNVWPHETGQQIAVTTDVSGVWVADLSGAYDIVIGSGGRAEIRDELYNGTAVDWYVSNPHFTVFPEWEFFDGLEWPDGATVTISVGGKPECETTKESWGGFFNGNFGEGCDLAVGDTVTFTDGVTTRTHTVQSLAITKVNQEDDIVKGTAGAGAEIHVWPHATGQELLATANPKGKWEVDFTAVYDLVTGDGGGRAQILDEQGNATAVDWNIPSPRLIAFPAVDQIYAYYWPAGSQVNLNINDKHVAQATVQGAPWDPNDVMALFDFAGLHDLAAGDNVMLSGHDLQISYTVQNLAVTEVDESANTVTGTADPGAVVMVYPFEFGDQPVFATADENGDWFANFGEDGIDLVPGMCGRSDIFDEFTNSTTVDWCIPWPARIIVHVEDDWFRAENFAPDTSLNFAIYPAPGGDLLYESVTAPTTANGEVSTWVGEGGFQIEPGQYIVVSDGSTTKDLVLEPLTFDVFDLATGYLQGTVPGPAGRGVFVGIGCWEREDLTMDVTSDENGTWIADFEAEIPNEFGCAFAWTYDGDGDASEARPPAP